MSARLRVTLTKSTVSTTQRARGTVRALGLRRIGHSVELPDTPEVRGQVRAVRYLVAFEEIPDPSAAPARRSRKAAGSKEEAES